MASLLNGVNEVFKRCKFIQGDSGSLASLSDSPRQVWIDQAVQIWNEVMEELYSVTDIPLPQELASSTITLVASSRAYSLASYNTLHWPFQDQTNGEYIYEYPGTYIDLIAAQPIPSNYTGLPLYGTIRETDGYIYLDRIPTSTEAGKVYTYQYDKDISMSSASDTFPFRDEVYRALIPVVAGLMKAENRKDAMPAFAENLGRAARLLSDKTVRTSYLPSSRGHSRDGAGFPFE